MSTAESKGESEPQIVSEQDGSSADVERKRALTASSEPQHVKQGSNASSSSFLSDGNIPPKAEHATASETPDVKPQGETSNNTQTNLSRQSSRADELGRTKIILIMFSLCMALFLSALDVTIITTALPTIAQHFKASSSGYTWVGSSYLLANASATPIWGKLSDIWGRKPMLITANIVFMIGSLIAALAVSIGMLIVGRVVQGLGGGGLIILVTIAISDLFSMRDRPKYYALVGATWAIASGVGPVIGGAFTQSVSWRWCFYINLPLDGVALLLLIFVLKLDTPKTPFWQGVKAIDWVGGVAIVGGVICFLYGLESAGIDHPWDSAFVICLIVFGIVLMVLFFLAEWKIAKYPIMPLRLFKDPSNMAAYGVCFLFGFVFIAQSYYLPLYFQTVLGLSPILSGVTLFALVIPLSMTSMATGIIMKKTGRYREVIWIFTSVLCLGTGLLIDLPNHRQWSKVIIYQVICGMGTGPLFQSPLIALQSHLKGYDVAVGTATYGFIRNISTSISVVLGGVVFQNELSKKQGALEQVLGPQLSQQFSGSSFGATAGQLRNLPAAQRAALDDAYTSSLKTMWIFYTAFAALMIFISFFITRVELSKERVKTKTGIEEQERIRKEQQELEKQRKEQKMSPTNPDKDMEAAVTAEKP